METYKYNDKNYKLEDFQSDTRNGWDEYRSSLKDGKKNQDELNQAYNYMMDGLSNGTVTIKDGNFYTTDENILNNKPLFGQVTYYLKRQLGKSNEYISPEEKRKVSLTSQAFQQNFNNYLFNSNEFNPLDFINLDAPDKKTGKRAMTNRLAQISDYLNQVDIDRDFKDFDDITKQRYVKYIQDAKNAIADGTITSNKYLTLSRLFGNAGLWDKIMTTEKDIPTDNPETPENNTEIPAQQQTPQQLLDNFMNAEIPEFTGQESGYELNTPKFGKYTFQIWENIMKNINNRDLVRMMDLLNDNPNINLSNMKYVVESAKKTGAAKLRIAYPNNAQSRSFVLNTMKYRNLLTKIGDGLYMYYSNKSPYALIWDEKQNKLYKKAARNVEYIVKSKLNEFNQTNGDTKGSWYKKYQQNDSTNKVESDKNGGVLKAQYGTQVNFKLDTPNLLNGIVQGITGNNDWYRQYMASQNSLPEGGSSNIESMVFYNDKDLSNDKRLRRQWNQKTKQYELVSRGDMAATDKISTGNKLYDVEGVDGSQVADDNLESMSWNPVWVNRLMTNSKLAESFARRYKDLNGATGEIQAKNWFNQDGTFNYDNFKKEIPNQNGKLFVWADKLNGIGHDVYRGRVYGIVDKDGKMLYYNNIPKDYELIPNSEKQIDDITNLYILRKKDGDQKDGDQITEENNIADLKIDNPYDKAGKADVLALSRLKLALDNNKRNEQILKNGLTPIQHDTYRMNTPVTGAYTTRSQYANSAANIESRMADLQISDGRARALAQLMGASQADEINAKGVAADVAERQRTAQQALQMEAANKERRQVIANQNIDSLAAHRSKLSEIEANRNMADFTSKDTYLKQYEADAKQKQLEKKLVYDNYIKTVSLAKAQQMFKKQLQAASDEFYKWYNKLTPQQQQNASLVQLSPEYKKYKMEVERIKNDQQAEANRIYMQVTGQPTITNNKYIWDKALEQTYKNGGKLIQKNKFLR